MESLAGSVCVAVEEAESLTTEAVLPHPQLSHASSAGRRLL